MGKSPGHQKWPEHKIAETHIDERMTVSIEHQIVAASREAIRVDEDGHPSRYYFPRAHVKMDCLAHSRTITRCPFKGVAAYFDINLGGKKYPDAAWSYEDAFEEHRALAGRISFDADKFAAIKIAAVA